VREKVVLIGAGSAMFTRGLVRDLLLRGWECELALVDTDCDALAVAEGLCKKMIAAKRAPVSLLASPDRRDVLDGATLVITTVGVGGRRAWEQDVFIPRRYDIFQPVGDSVMPGGTSRALRMIPPMVEIASDVLDLAPNALFVNYANPMAAICRAVRKATGAPVVGLCMGVSMVANQIARWLSLDPSRFQYTAVGINHLTWFLEMRTDGVDLLPRMHQRGEAVLGSNFHLDSLATGSAKAGTDGLDDAAVNRTDPFCLQLLRIFGGFPAVKDRHVSEFFPAFFPDGTHFGKTLGVDRFSFEQVIADGDAIYQDMREQALSRGTSAAQLFEEAGGESEQAVDLVESVRLDKGTTYSANLPNQGQVPNLPAEVIVEAPAIATAAGMRPIGQRPLPQGIAGTLATRYCWVETAVEAALEGSRRKFVQALVLDGAVRDIATAEKLADELLAAQAEHLPRFQQALAK
jgi:alpha-galactosidase